MSVSLVTELIWHSLYLHLTFLYATAAYLHHLLGFQYAYLLSSSSLHDHCYPLQRSYTYLECPIKVSSFPDTVTEEDSTP
jgi:hypothetical protein